MANGVAGYIFYQEVSEVNEYGRAGLVNRRLLSRLCPTSTLFVMLSYGLSRALRIYVYSFAHLVVVGTDDQSYINMLMKKLITGLNHLTIAVSDLSRSFDFYVDVLGFKPQGLWNKGAYLSAGDLWLCLTLEIAIPARDYTHYAFSVNDSDFDDCVVRLENWGSTCWKENSSEGSSYYFLDPDGHKLEIHSGDLKSRLMAVESKPYSGWSYPK